MFSWMVCFTSFQSMPQVMVCIVGMKCHNALSEVKSTFLFGEALFCCL